MCGLIKNLYNYRYLFAEIVRKNIKLQYRNSVLGIFWTLLQPFLTTVVLVLVFSGIFGKSSKLVVNYPIYLLCGRMLYEFFSQSTKRAMRSVRLSAGVIKKVYIPKYIYPISNVTSNFITFLISLIVLVAFIIFFKVTNNNPVHMTGYVFLAWVPILILFFLCVGIGLILSVLEVFFKDTEYLYDVFCMLIFYLTPVFYNVKQLHISSKIVRLGLMANPLYSIVSMFRSCVLYGEMWNWNWFYYAAGMSIFLMLTGSLLFWKTQDKFILHL
ncbi:MAG: ABC transporter permease [Clostridiales bacterium]|nr:ABC transporter permease [Clostridiales bacterium]